MTARWVGFHSPLGGGIEAFLAHKRALGCRFWSEELVLRLLDRFLVEQHVTSLDDISHAIIDAFLASRSRRSPGSYNHLRGSVARLFAWLAAHDLMPRSPVQARPRRTTQSRLPFLFDPAAARRLLDVAGRLHDNPIAPL